jgi:hypothetical protein
MWYKNKMERHRRRKHVSMAMLTIHLWYDLPVQIRPYISHSHRHTYWSENPGTSPLIRSAIVASSPNDFDVWGYERDEEEEIELIAYTLTQHPDRRPQFG